MKKRKEWYGTAKIVDRDTDQNANVERTTKHGTLEANEGAAFDTCVRIEIVSYRARLADADGISAKYAIDGLVHAGILKDDSAKYVEEVRYRQVKVKNKSDEKTVINIEACE